MIAIKICPVINKMKKVLVPKWGIRKVVPRIIMELIKPDKNKCQGTIFNFDMVVKSPKKTKIIDAVKNPTKKNVIFAVMADPIYLEIAPFIGK